MAHPRSWRLRNLPLPEQHLTGLALSLLLHRLRPRRLGATAPIRIGAGALIGAGVALAVWAARTAGSEDLERPERLITTGPYARSRNPMYVGWTLGYLGVAGLADAAWPLVLAPGVAVAVHRQVRREEDRLSARFGAELEAYTAKVRRYL